MSDKITELKRYFPEPFYKLRPNQGLSIILEILGGQLNELMSQQREAADQLLLATAVGKYLIQHGLNYDVFKPRGYRMPDKTYREIIKVVSNSQKNIERIFERILSIYFGPDAINKGLCDVYSVRPNEIIVEIKENALIVASTRDLYGTTYLHATNESTMKDAYPSGYLYDREIKIDLVGSYTPSDSVINVGTTNLEKFPLSGTIYIGNPKGSNFEAKGFTRVSETSQTWQLDGPLNFYHSSGDAIVLPNINRKIRSVLNQTISVGSIANEISVQNSADFPLENGALKIDGSFLNEEIVPFVSRKVSDNTKIIIDPNYQFRFSHAPGAKVQLMARKTAPSGDGLNWPFYVNDTDALRTQFFNLLRRLKATGVKMVFELV
ncbi:MAG: hypothetical protein ACXVCY_04110 [Pseudobdellovibrionaceae bacterium]